MCISVSIDHIIKFGYNYTRILEKSNRCPLKYEIYNQQVFVRIPNAMGVTM